MTKTLNGILVKALIVVSSGYLGFLLVQNLSVLVKESVFPYLLPYLAFIFILYFILNKLKIESKYFILILFILAFISKAGVALIVNTPPISDFQLFYDAAVKASQGDFSFSGSGYFKYWGYQTGIVLFYSGIIKIMGPGILPIKLVNCAFMAGTNILIYLMAKRMVSEKYSRLAALMYLVYPAPYFLASVLTNQHISNFFLFLGIYIIISRSSLNLRNTIAAAFILALGNAFRPQGIVIAASVLVLGISDLLDRKQDGEHKQNKGIYFILIIIFYLLTGNMFSYLVKVTGVNENGLNNNFPLYKFVVGLNHETDGNYSDKDVKALMSISNDEARNEKAMELIRERTGDPVKLLKLVIRKQFLMWSSLDTTFSWGFFHLENNEPETGDEISSFSSIRLLIQKLEKALYLLVFVFALTSILSMLKMKSYDKNALLLILLVMANFAVYCFVEIQHRYRDFAMIPLFIIAAGGLESIERFVTARVNNISKVSANEEN